MTMIEHILTLRGPRVSGGRPCPEAVGRVLRLIEPAVRESVSMGFRNTSRLPGRRPEWFRRASDIRFVDVSKGPQDATLLHFEAPQFGQAAEDLYRQGELFRVRPDQEDTGFDLLGDVLTDIRHSAEDSLNFDAKLLRHVACFKRLGQREGVDSAAVTGHRLASDHPPTLDADLANAAQSMCSRTPPARRARIAGKLDMIRDHDNVFEMILEDSETVRGLWTGGDMATLGDFFRQDVVIEGQAVFRVSGKLLRIEAEAIKTATGADDFFRRIPEPAARRLDRRSLLRPQTPTTGAAAVHGGWPGDETEEQILAALKDMG